MTSVKKKTFHSPFYTKVNSDIFVRNKRKREKKCDISNNNNNENRADTDNDNSDSISTEYKDNTEYHTHSRVSICCPKNNTRGSIILAVAGVAVALRVALNLQVKWGYLKEHDSALGLFAIALVAGFTLLMVPGILVRWERTREIGFIIYHRVGDINAVKKNWEDETLRSFIELCIWLGVCWGTWGHSKSVLQSVLCGSFAGCFVAIIGDTTAPYIKNLETILQRASLEAAGEHSANNEIDNLKVTNTIDNDNSNGSGSIQSNNSINETSSTYNSNNLHASHENSRHTMTSKGQTFMERESDAIFDTRKSGTLLTLTIYGYNLFSMTYSICNDLILAAVICASAATILLSVARIFLQYERTKRLGRVIQDRIFCTFENWSTHPMRSTLESMIWTGVTIGAYTAYGSLLLAIQAGTLTGILICVFGELNTLGTDDGASEEPKEVRLVPLCIFGYFGLASSYFILHNSHSVYTASLMTAMAGAGYLIAGRLFMYWSPTRRAGELIQGRFTETVANWEVYTFRSALEAGVWVVSWWITFVVTRNFWLPTPVGTFVSIAMVLISDFLGCGANAGGNSMFDSKTKIDVCAPYCNEGSRQIENTESFVVETKYNTSKENYLTTQCLINQLNQSQNIFSIDEVSNHNNEKDAWIIIHGLVYDITHFVSTHPGGKDIILKYAGYDASDQFEAFHEARVKKFLKSYLIGKMGEVLCTSKMDATNDYRELRKKLWDGGYFECNHSYYLLKHLIWVSLISSGVFIVIHYKNNKLAMILSALFVGMGLVQAAFISHDALHNSIIQLGKTRASFNWYGWFVGSVVFGISSDMWCVEHNLHHAVTLRPREDPQYNMLPFFMVTKKELQGRYRFNPSNNIWLGEIAKIFVSMQHCTLIPFALLVGRFNLCRLSIVYTFTNCLKKPQAAMDVIGMSIHWLTFYLLMFYGFNNNSDRFFYFACICITVGTLHVQLLVSHIATENFFEDEERKMGFFEFQLRTTRNLECQGRTWEHILHGGLEYQIEHHLFPRLPRHNLHLVQPFVKQICKKHSIRYESISFLRALTECLLKMKELAHDIVTPHEICSSSDSVS
jgi:sphingolipid 8-(E/Z)-desaturase